MAQVSWIKIYVSMFDNRKIKYLRKLPNGDAIVLIWVMLLTIAGRCNAGGMIFLTQNVPYTVKMLADELDFDESTVQLAISAFERLDMLTTSDDGMIHVTGWEEHQSSDKLADLREYNRLAQQKSRSKKRAIAQSNADVNDMSMTGQPCQDIEEEEKDIEYLSFFEGKEVLRVSIPLKNNDFFRATESDVANMRNKYPSVDINSELSQMAQWAENNPAKRKSRREVRGFIDRWLSEKQDKADSACRPPGGVSAKNDQRNAQYERQGEITPMGLESIKRLMSNSKKGEDDYDDLSGQSDCHAVGAAGQAQTI